MKPHAVLLAPLAFITALMLCGCAPPEIERLEPLKKADAEGAEAESASIESDSQPWWSSLELPFEVWYVQYAGGKRIGYYQTLIREPNEVREGVIIESEGLFTLKSRPSASQPTSYKFTLESQEDGEGNISRFTEETSADGVATRIDGRLLGDKLTLITKSPDGQKKRSVSWQEGTWGVLGIQSMLFSQPIQANQTRECRIFVPQVGQIITVELRAGLPEITSLPGGRTPELIPVDVVMQSKEGVARSRNWVTPKGLIEKTVSYNPTISTFRAPTEVAARFRDEMLLGRQLSSFVDYKGDPPADSDESFAYQVEGSRDPYSVFVNSSRQHVKSETALRTRVTVFHKPRKTNAGESKTPLDVYLQSSDLIQSEHPSIARLAEELSADLPQESEATQVAVGLAEGLNQRITNSDERASIASALETARRMEGDNRGQAVLLTAVLRNRGIPARLAFGLKLSDRNSRLSFFTWTEAWCQGHWVSLDPMEGKRIGLDVLKMADSALADTNPYTEILDVYNKMQSISLSQAKSL